jgi:hypothetical protein
VTQLLVSASLRCRCRCRGAILQTFWETQPLQGGQQHIWESLRLAADALLNGDVELCTTVIEVRVPCQFCSSCLFPVHLSCPPAIHVFHLSSHEGKPYKRCTCHFAAVVLGVVSVALFA